MKRTLAAVGVMLSLIGGSAMAGTIDLYEGNGGSQNKIGTLTDRPGQNINLKNSNIDNDEARSLVLNDVRPGALIRVYDDPRGRPSKDDWTEIHVKQGATQYTVSSFERTYEDDVVRVIFHRNNGLDGKVSHIKIH
jgi:hypothetical protein